MLQPRESGRQGRRAGHGWIEEFRRVRVDNCGLTAVALAGGHIEVKFVNVLADPERSWDPVHWSKRT